ncbi:hypothetical protein K505DRAFT_378362 [Melanomma pulvis-pyrius CBS 109.77]|uniref:HNH nuclease domain-containing protein n=1 Tax=Melanomma pulvis-pyrius CBS 109.77 TaxID=1314802 RepID=A0A6A6WZ66_9PLEO|nr:hypothetical protein K505DRAFT_378362 [Melanomma pulvis-pyrius CBS 109.77]
MVHLKTALHALIELVCAGTLAIPAPSIPLPPLLVRDVERLNKSILQPALPDLSPGLIANLNGSIEKIKRWDNGMINEDCKKWMTSIGAVNLKTDVEMYNITFSDCAQPWVMCRHKFASYKIDATAVAFARIPVLMRSHIRHVIMLPATNHNGKSISNDLDNVVVMGDPTFHEFVVGVAKSMDSHGFDRTVGPFSKSPKWQSAFDRDTAVPNSLASLNQQENLAQLVAIALYDTHVPNGIKGVVPQWEKIRNQYEEIEKDAFNNEFTEYGEREGLKCKDRARDSEIIPVWRG